MSDPVDIYCGFVHEEQEAADAARKEGSPLSVYQEFLRRRRAGDSEAAQDILDLLGRLNAESGQTLVMVTHAPEVG